MSKDNAQGRLGDYFNLYLKNKQSVTEARSILDEKQQRLASVKNEMDTMLAEVSLESTIEAIDSKIRPILFELSDYDQQAEHSCCLLVLAGAPHIGILILGKRSSTPVNSESGGNKIFFEIYNNIFSGRFMLYPILEGNALTEEISEKIIDLGIEYLIDFSAGKLFHVPHLEYAAENINHCVWTPWVRID